MSLTQPGGQAVSQSLSQSGSHSVSQSVSHSPSHSLSQFRSQSLRQSLSPFVAGRVQSFGPERSLQSAWHKVYFLCVCVSV